jgi:ribbon-helix-helix CopG family protein
MKRTNIYLDDEQLELLRRLGEQRGEPVAALVRTAVDSWLEAQGARRLDDDEWTRRFDRLLTKRRRLAEEGGFSAKEVERDVTRAVKEVRRAKAARRR